MRPKTFGEYKRIATMLDENQPVTTEELVQFFKACLGLLDARLTHAEGAISEICHICPNIQAAVIHAMENGSKPND